MANAKEYSVVRALLRRAILSDELELLEALLIGSGGTGTEVVAEDDGQLPV